MNEDLERELAGQPEVAALRKEALERLAAASDESSLEDVRVSVLGRKGSLTAFLRSVGSLPEEQRPGAGKVVNLIREEVEGALAAKAAELAAESRAEEVESGWLDITMPGYNLPHGRRHPTMRVIEEIGDIFVALGYEAVEGREVETDYFNFTALNTPPDHPARALTDTFYLEPELGGRVGEVLLRTHTSPVQVHVLESRRPPVYIISPGKAYRRDYDVTHTPMFHQVEGFAVDVGITFTDLKGTLEAFVKAMFGEERRIRMRPHFFPFTEPSAEVDVSCFVCDGAGCRLCKGSGWLEILGCGMIDPEVFRLCGYDGHEDVTGFAFGMGVERIAQLKYGLTDMRMLYENDIRFLKRFR